MECCLFETFIWDLKWDVLFETFETFQTYHGGLLVWIFPSNGCAAYLKLSDETWNEMCYLKLLKLFKPIMEGCLFETFRWDLKWDVLFETFETCQPITGVAYLKLSDDIWNEICYLKHLKCLKLETVKTCNGSCLFQTFRWDLKWDVLFQTFETWNFSNLSNPSKGLLIWNF